MECKGPYFLNVLDSELHLVCSKIPGIEESSEDMSQSVQVLSLGSESSSSRSLRIWEMRRLVIPQINKKKGKHKTGA